VQATDEDAIREVAEELDEDRDPSEEELAETKEQLVLEAVTRLRKPAVRDKLLGLQSQTEQVIDIATQDKLVRAGFKDADDAKHVVETFEQWIKDHHDEYLALKAYFDRPHHLRPTLKDIKELVQALKAPPLHLTSERLWQAYKALDESKVRGEGGKLLADVVSLIRFAVGEDQELIPHTDLVKLRFDLWLHDQESNGQKFSAIQRGWLMMVRDHMATSLTIEPDDFDLDPFAQEGGFAAAYDVFGQDLNPLLDELNERLCV
jgi:type I restriction enzyme R subunit